MRGVRGVRGLRGAMVMGGAGRGGSRWSAMEGAVSVGEVRGMSGVEKGRARGMIGEEEGGARGMNGIGEGRMGGMSGMEGPATGCGGTGMTARWSAHLDLVHEQEMHQGWTDISTGSGAGRERSGTGGGGTAGRVVTGAEGVS